MSDYVEKGELTVTKALLEAQISALSKQVQQIRTDLANTTSSTSTAFIPKIALLQSQIDVINKQLAAAIGSLNTLLEGRQTTNIVAIKALIQSQISILTQRLNEIASDVTTLTEVASPNVNAEKIKKYPIDLTNLSNNCVLVFDNVRKKFVCKPYHT